MLIGIAAVMSAVRPWVFNTSRTKNRQCGRCADALIGEDWGAIGLQKYTPVSYHARTSPEYLPRIGLWGPYYSSRIFKKVMGKTPTGYRKISAFGQKRKGNPARSL